jgi:antitoxin CptB
MNDLARLRWKCRRGTLELDLILVRFLDSHYASLPHAQQQAFDALLEAGDEDLWRIVNHETECATPALQAVASLLRTC